jgi:hypothetical protein
MPQQTLEDRKARVLPTDIDVLCGSGKGKAGHPGNRRFRCIVAKHCEKYVTAKTKAEKMKVSKHILLEVLANGARIIQKHPIHEEWYVADPKVGRDKISHCLRLIKAATKRTDGRDLDTSMIQQPENRQSVTLDNHQPPIAGLGGKSRQGIGVRQQRREQHPNVLLDTMVPFPVGRRNLALPPPQQPAITRIIKAEYPLWSRSYMREEIKPSYYHMISRQEEQLSSIIPSSLFSMMDIRRPPDIHFAVATDAIRSASQRLALQRQSVLLNEILHFRSLQRQRQIY